MRMNSSYPLTCRLEASASAPLELEVKNLFVDNSPFYERCLNLRRKKNRPQKEAVLNEPTLRGDLFCGRLPDQIGCNLPQLTLRAFFLRQGLLQERNYFVLAKLLRETDRGHVARHLVMLYATSGADEPEIENSVVSILAKSFRSFFNTALHADAFLPARLCFQNRGDFLEPRHLGLGFLQMPLESRLKGRVARSFRHLRDSLRELLFRRVKPRRVSAAVGFRQTVPKGPVWCPKNP
jgi:hypothetical protein